VGASAGFMIWEPKALLENEVMRKEKNHVLLPGREV
jgi:hypothetical protein